MRKNFLKLSISMLSFVFASLSHADLVSEFGLSLSKTSVNQFLSQISGEFEIKDEPIEIAKEGILKDLQYSSSKLFLDADLDFKFVEGDALKAHAEVESVGIKLIDFSYTQVTYIKQTGLDAKVITNLKCSELVVELNDWSVDLMSPVKFEKGQILLERDKGDLDPKGQAVRVDLSKCSAPKGIDIVLKDMIRDWINSSEGNELLFGAVLDYGQEFIDTEFDKLKNVLNLQILNKRIDLVFESASFLKDKIEVEGLLKAESDKSNYNLSLNKSDFDKAKTGADVLLPKEFFTKLFPDFMKEVTVDFEIKRAQVPQVDFLFNNRFIQFFVWRDLLNFKKSSDFAAGVQVKTQKLSLAKMGQGFTYNFYGNHRIDMDFLNSKGSRYPYMDFKGAMAGSLSLDLTDKGVSIEITNPDMSAKPSWDSDMNRWRKSKPSGKPWMSVIIPRIKKALNKTSFDYSWSDLGLGDYINKAELYQSEKSVLLGISLND